MEHPRKIYHGALKSVIISEIPRRARYFDDLQPGLAKSPGNGVAREVSDVRHAKMPPAPAEESRDERLNVGRGEDADTVRFEMVSDFAQQLHRGSDVLDDID